MFEHHVSLKAPILPHKLTFIKKTLYTINKFKKKQYNIKITFPLKKYI